MLRQTSHDIDVGAVRYTIKAVSARTGVSVHTLRAWERRYSALSPQRTDANQRYYGEEDVERIESIKSAIDQGHSVGQIANLPIENLRKLNSGRSDRGPSLTNSLRSRVSSLQSCIDAVMAFDSEALDRELQNAIGVLGLPTAIEQVIAPLLEHIGSGWVDDGISIAQEHTASAAVRSVLSRSIASFRPSPTAPRILVGTPVSQNHELGAVMVAAVSAALGWNVTYIGANLPADDIVEAARLRSVRVVALSVVFPPANPDVATALRKIGSALRLQVTIIVGGRVAHSYAEVIDDVGGEVITDIASLRSLLLREFANS